MFRRLAWIAPDQVKRLRRRGGLTQRELARRAHLSNALISRLERRKKKVVVSLYVVQALARALKVDFQVIGERVAGT